MWATLLATSLMPEFSGAAEPDFHKILAQLSPSEAKILNGLYDGSLISENRDAKEQLELIANALEVGNEQGRVLLLNLHRLAFIQGENLLYQYVVEMESLEGYFLSELGQSFIERCNFFSEEVS